MSDSIRQMLPEMDKLNAIMPMITTVKSMQTMMLGMNYSMVGMQVRRRPDK
ncbi:MULTISPECIES: hypothetical protein [Mycolicibacterium]|uniref:Uncharacterized protein n=1 Tax=Mycolicibacterium porcinum TaxID=39693 RepID=A0ABV3VB82_9MYCO|nr:hypothetical protein [Mycolicibacterium fortuitum]